MKKIISIVIILFSLVGVAQDISMANGSFNRCAPDKFFDSGGEFGNYGLNENFVTTICSQNTGEFIILDFTTFITQQGPNADTMNIYDGDDTTAPLLGAFEGPVGPFTVSASAANISGCLTVEFISSDAGSGSGWEANILCAAPCQTITASIDSTDPEPNGTGVIGIVPGDTVDFTGSAVFSDDNTNATYTWDFGDGNTANGSNVSNTFLNPGTYTVNLTASDANPQGCSDTVSIIVFVLGDNLVVDQDSFTVEQLVQDVLVNSPCASVSNITSSTGVDFSTTEPNGIGYFFSNGVSFPFEDGLLLMSGDASQAEGPNTGTLSEGTNIWPGDADLDAELGVDSRNATFIQFDFVPQAETFSFEFLMASEEYDMGTFECTFSDAFAFLLTDSNGVTTNLAVIPGTNTPILVTNIHPDNGAACGAANPQFFGEYTPFNQPPIGFDGRTTEFTATSTVVSGELYTIKLVVADDRDNVFDTGVFIKAGSFNIGGSLGEDFTIAAGTALCDDTEIELDTALETAIHIWYKDDEVIPGEVSSTLTVTEPGVYFAEIDIDGVCEGTTDPIVIEFRDNPTAEPAVDLIGCSVTGFTEFDLTENDTNILGALDPADYTITYHLTEDDANNNVGVLPTNYTNVANPQVIWARMAEATQVCFDTVFFEISASTQPEINPVGAISLCDDESNDGIAEFDLSTQTAGILGAQLATEFTVSY
ncbi:choice-of-anchor L domain-containing protein, partial [uncultured Winogradskyella sp.]|uniref:choice-of-anchor L domain-containing protein n=1 Tax=uncultured Winogradskyella sp. TaxID=395353 RepID=UPI00262EADC3